MVPLLALKDLIHKHVIMFGDHEPARHVLSKGFGKDGSISCLLQHSWRYIESQLLRPAWQGMTFPAIVSGAVSRGDQKAAR